MHDHPVVIVGSSGQDGRILSQSLSEQKIHRVVYITRHSLTYLGIAKAFNILAYSEVFELVNKLKPKAVYYLCAHHQSSEEANIPDIVQDYQAHHSVHVGGLLNFLTAIQCSSRKTKLFYAASSLIFSGSSDTSQTEETPFSPIGIYGLTKAQGVYLCRHFRETYDIHASTGILYTHESKYRSTRFLVRRLIDAALKIQRGELDCVQVGNLDAINDWGYANDFVRAFQLILQLPSSHDFIVSTGEGQSVRNLCETIFSYLGMDYHKYVVVSPHLSKRSTQPRIGDYSRLKHLTGWQPSMCFTDMLKKLIHDIAEDGAPSSPDSR